MENGERGSSPTPDVAVLGQIMAAQNMFFVLPDKKNIAQFYASMLSTVPGVEVCVVCLGGVQSSEGDEGCTTCDVLKKGANTSSAIEKWATCLKANAPGHLAISLDTIDHRYGFFVFKLSDARTFELYNPFINNLANFVALSLENAAQRRDLQSRAVELEKKNAELEKMNRLFVGRELAMIDLKKQVKELEAQLGRNSGKL